MRFLLPLFVIAVLLVSCFLPWVSIESRGITITGVETTGTLYGKPAYFHFFWVGLYLCVLLFNNVWARRVAMVFAAFNLAWAARNFLLLPACQMGECPVRRIGLYLLLAASLALVFAGLIGPAEKQPSVNTSEPSKEI